MFLFDQKFARDEQATAGSAVDFASAESSKVASAATKVRGSGEFGEEEASPAATVRGYETRKPEANQTLEGTPGKRPFLRQSLVPVVPHLQRQPKEMEYCCPQFEAKWNARNDRGTSIYVCPPEKGHDEPSFVLLSRGIRKGEEAVLGQIPRGTKLEINISARIRIRFCPWCGRELKRFYAESYQSLIDPEILAEMKEDGGLTSGQSATAGKRPPSNLSPRPAVAHP